MTASWQERLEQVYQLMREMSLQTDPQAMVRAYGDRVRSILPVDRRLSLSRRELRFPKYRITRYTGWNEEINPWKEQHRLPLLKGGILAELLYSNQPRIINDFDVHKDDPAYEYLEGQRSLMAIPMFDRGEALNMVVSTLVQPGGFDRERLPDTFWLANLFGRATHNLVLRQQLQQAYHAIDRELKLVGAIQRSLLPEATPVIPSLQLATHYRTSQRAGGDYFDFFPLSNEKWGLLVADVSGHGTPAAVVMAITHSIAHLFPGRPVDAADLLEFVNRQLAIRYTHGLEAFVTAFYGVYDASKRTLSYASAGHNPPRVWRPESQEMIPLDATGGLPLGVLGEAGYQSSTIQLQPGDRIILYTDGILDTWNPDGLSFGISRLEAILSDPAPGLSAKTLVESIIRQLDAFAAGTLLTDDQTIVVGVVK